MSVDSEHVEQLRERLQYARRLLHVDELHRAMYGIGTEPAVIIRIEDRKKEIAELEKQLKGVS